MNVVKLTNLEENGFYGRYAPVNSGVHSALIICVDDDVNGFLAKGALKWAKELGVNALAVSPDKKECGYHSYPLEQVENAVKYLKANGNQKIGIVGLSAPSMVALAAASLLPDITLTIALTPPDFVMEGYYTVKLDGTGEHPGNYESSLTWREKPLPFLPYAYRHPEYWQKHVEESKRRGDLIAARDLFDESERRHPLEEEEKIKIENIHGHIYFAAAEDDVLWDSCKYIRRMMKRLEELPHYCTYEAHLYEHGTHFVFPEGMVRKFIPFGLNLLLPLVFKEAKGHTKECRETRQDIQRGLMDVIRKWQTGSLKTKKGEHENERTV